MARRRVSAESANDGEDVMYRKHSVTALLRMSDYAEYDVDNDAATTEASSCKEEIKEESCGRRVYKKMQAMGMIRLFVWLVITIDKKAAMKLALIQHEIDGMNITVSRPEDPGSAFPEDMSISEKIGQLAGTLGLGNRFYYMAMDQSRTRLLNEIWVRKQNMRNQMTMRRGSAYSDMGEDFMLYNKLTSTMPLMSAPESGADADNDATATEASSYKDEPKPDPLRWRVYKKMQAMGMIRLFVWLAITIIYSWLGALAFRLAECEWAGVIGPTEMWEQPINECAPLQPKWMKRYAINRI
ncbi:unnamed protein product [Sphagnum balticum]